MSYKQKHLSKYHYEKRPKSPVKSALLSKEPGYFHAILTD